MASRNKAKVTMTFAVTFVVPEGMNIPSVRQAIKDSLVRDSELGLKDETSLKVYLTNKEVQYAKR